MNIQEAVKRAMEQNGFIYRKKFVIEKRIKEFKTAVVAPSNSLDCRDLLEIKAKLDAAGVPTREVKVDKLS